MGHLDGEESLRTGDVLPSSRAKESKGVVRATLSRTPSMNWVPIFCANCGKSGGFVPEENCSFACYLCDPCAEVHGEAFGHLMVPDEVFWSRVAEEQLNRYRRILTPEEFQVLAESTWGAMSKLLRESPNKT
jgi:hypothetical protein